METSTSRKKILILGRPNSGKLSLVKALTSSLPDGLNHESTPHAGLTHSITLTTRYYSTHAGIWIDEIPDDAETWLDEYLSDEAIPVLQSVAAIILTVNDPTGASAKDLRILKQLSDRGEKVEWEGTCIVVRKVSDSKDAPELSSLCEDEALEFVDMNSSGENEFGGTFS